MNIILSPKNRKSLSPLRGRKIIQKNNLLKQSKKCENHENKEGNFFVQSQKQRLYYCRNCAVRLASQGFQIMQDINKNQGQIYQFMQQLKGLIKHLNNKKLLMDKKIYKAESCLKNQIQQISNYYTQFYQIIKQHENRVIEQIKIQYQKISNNTKQFIHKVEDAIIISQKMKKDFEICLNDCNFSTSIQGYDSIIAKYKIKLNQFRNLVVDKQVQKQLKIKTLSFKDCQEVCQIIIQNMQIQWNNQSNNNIEMIQTQKSFQRLLSGKKNKNINVCGSF